MSIYDSLYAKYMQEANDYASSFNIEPSTAHNGAWDAFRHAYASGAMANEYGEYIARAFGDLNELRGDIYHNQPSYEKNMDKWNNSVGRTIGKNGINKDNIASRVYEALKRGDLITDPWNDARHYDSDNSSTEDSIGYGNPGGMSPSSAAAAEAATVAPRIDPLVLDLDGDGIETTSTRNGSIILFDHDGDGIKTGTGWVKPDDGWLVLDRNGNGTMDSGHELFGVNTIKSNGHLAKDGFDALKDLDANQDDKVDSIDEVFANLRIWRDLNQDGISQGNELSTLGDNSITAININSTAVRNDLGNGNIQTAAGSFTRSNGTTGITGETSESAAGNLDLLVSTFYRQFTTHIPLTHQAKSLPSLRGSGQVRDLNEAISLSTDLAETVASYTQQTTRQDQINQLDRFIDQWANTSEMKSLKEQANALASSGVSLTYQLAGLTPGSQAYEDFIHKLGVVERFMGFTYAGANGQPRFTFLNANSGKLTVSLAGPQIDNVSLAYERLKTDIYESLLIQTRLKGYFEKLDISLTDNKVVLNFQPVEEAFKASVSLNPREGIIDLIEFLSAVGETRLQNLNWNATDFLVGQLNTAPELGAFSEELSRGIIRFAAANEHNLFGSSRADLIIGSDEVDTITTFDGNDIILGKGGDDTLNGGSGNDQILGGEGNDSIYSGDGNDYIDGGKGNDSINGGSGNDIYLFSLGSGKDTIWDHDFTNDNIDTVLFSDVASIDVTSIELKNSDLIINYGKSDSLILKYYFGNASYIIEQFEFSDGITWDEAAIKSRVIINGDDNNNYLNGYYGGSNRIYGLGGNDYLSGGDMSDLLDGGKGNDTLQGQEGSDTYLFKRGYGKDTIYDYDSTEDNSDIVIFSDIASTDVKSIERSDDDLIINFGDSDSLIVSSYFYSSSYKIEQFKFSDKVIWNNEILKSQIFIKGDENNNNIYGINDRSNRIYGLGGNDYIVGGEKEDVIIGGEGDDHLNGNEGNDSYLFSIGSGKDIISDYDYTTDNIDTASFTDLASTNVKSIGRIEGDLVIHYGSNDSLTVQYYFYSTNYMIEQFKFIDDVIWNETDIKSRVVTHGDEYDNRIYGYDGGSNRIFGLGGDDNLIGGNQDDVMDGGIGNDKLAGNTGNDTYLFSIGSGVDRINDYDDTENNYDTVSFSDIASTDVTSLERVDDDLVIKYGSSDILNISNYFYGSNYKIEQFRFNDGVNWDDTEIRSRVFKNISDVGIDNDNLIDGSNADDMIDGGTGNDKLYGNAGEDQLYGGIGNDILYGGDDDDVLDGGTGDDILYGGKGNDIYQFAIGSGEDVIKEAAFDIENNDVMKFIDVASTELSSIEQDKNDLIIRYGINDQIRVVNYFYEFYSSEESGTPNRIIDQFNFNDGVTWDEEDIKSRVIVKGDNEDNYIYGNAYISNRIYGLNGNDHLDGGNEEDVLNGGDDNDILISYSGSDQLFGGSGDDELQGGYGDDVLNGGEGNDIFYDEEGSDTYLFSLGSGVDIITDYYYLNDSVDIVSFSNVASTAVTSIERIGNELVVNYGSSDSLTITKYFYRTNYMIEQFRFSDGVTWEYADIKSRTNSNLDYIEIDNAIDGSDEDDVIDGRGGNDEIYGYAGADRLFGGLGNDELDGGYDDDYLDGGAGNDELYGGDGGDVLDGGEGNDYLDGGMGNDTYQFGLGSGLDRVSDYDYQSGNNDVLSVGRGVEANQIWLRRVDNDLEISIIGTGDKTTISNWYYGSSYHIEEFKTSDGKTLLDSQVDALVSAMAAFAPPKAGETTLPADYQNTLNAVIAANWK